MRWQQRLAFKELSIGHLHVAYDAEASVVSGRTGINNAALRGLARKDLLPARIRLEIHTGGGAAFGYQNRQFLVR